MAKLTRQEAEKKLHDEYIERLRQKDALAPIEPVVVASTPENIDVVIQSCVKTAVSIKRAEAMSARDRRMVALLTSRSQAEIALDINVAKMESLYASIKAHIISLKAVVNKYKMVDINNINSSEARLELDKLMANGNIMVSLISEYIELTILNSSIIEAILANTTNKDKVKDLHERLVENDELKEKMKKLQRRNFGKYGAQYA